MLLSIIGVCSAAFYCLIISIFLSSAIGKLQNQKTFAQVIENYALTPAGSNRFFAIAIPIFEISLVILSIIPSTKYLGFLCLLVLLVGYTSLLLITRIRGVELDNCGCSFSYSSIPNQKMSTVDGWLVIRNLSLVSMSGFALFFAETITTLGILHWFIALVFSFLLFLFYWIYETLIQNYHLLKSLRFRNG